MRVLAWDTSQKTGVVAAFEWADESPVKKPEVSGVHGVKLVAELALSVDISQHSEGLLWGIHQVLKSARWKIDSVDAFAVGVGPGSFTGLRVGVTTARTLGQTLNKPVIPLSSLALLARPVALAYAALKDPVLVLAVSDAAKGEWFALSGLAKSVKDCVVMSHDDAPGVWKRGVEEKVVKPEEFLKALKKKQGKTFPKWVVIGEALTRYPEVFEFLPSAKRIFLEMPYHSLIQPRMLGVLAWEAVQSGVMRPALSVHPRYLRAPDAEVKLKAGLLRSAPTEGSS